MLTLHTSEESGRFVARCPEFEVVGTGRTKRETFDSLCNCIILNCRAKRRSGKTDENTRLVLADSKNPTTWFAEEQLAKHGLK